jgi:hypothetical protein
LARPSVTGTQANDGFRAMNNSSAPSAFDRQRPLVPVRFQEHHFADMRTTTPLFSNQDFYGYLLRLADVLVERGSLGLAEDVRGAASQAAGMSTEFLGESRIALRRVQATEAGALRPPEREHLVAVIDQLDKALVR